MPPNKERILRALRESKSDGRWLRVSCPECFERTGKVDRRGSLSHNPDSGYYACWKCGVKGFVNDRPVRRVQHTPKPAGLPPGFEPLAALRGALCSAQAETFLAGRGLRREVWEAAGVGISPNPPFDSRVIIPIHWPNGAVAGAVGRTWVKRAFMPYLYTKDLPRGALLYNQARLAQPGRVYVVEGVLDVLALWPHAVALLGKASETQEAILAASPAELVVLLDGDAFADAQALELRLKLAGHPNARAVQLPPGKDPDEMSKEWLSQC